MVLLPEIPHKGAEAVDLSAGEADGAQSAACNDVRDEVGNGKGCGGLTNYMCFDFVDSMSV